MKFSILAVLSMITFASSLVFAKDGGGGRGWMFEPAFGYSSYSGSRKFVGSSTTLSYTGSSIPVSAMLGYSWGSFYLGIESNYQASGKSTGTAAGSKEDAFDRGAGSVQIGIRKGRVRLSAEYTAYDAMTYKPNGLTTYTKFVGTGFGASLGYQFMNHLAVDLVYNVSTYTTYKNSSGTSGTVSSVYSAFDSSSAGLVFVFPFGS